MQAIDYWVRIPLVFLFTLISLQRQPLLEEPQRRRCRRAGSLAVSRRCDLQPPPLVLEGLFA